MEKKMQMGSQELFGDMDNKNFETGTRTWTSEDLAWGVFKTAQKARQHDKAGYFMKSDSRETRDLMRKLLLDEIGGEWVGTDVAPDGSGSWWRVELKNGSCIVICKEGITAKQINDECAARR